MENDAKKTVHSFTTAIEFSKEFVAVIVDILHPTQIDFKKTAEDRAAATQRELDRAGHFLAGALYAARHLGGSDKP